LSVRNYSEIVGELSLGKIHKIFIKSSFANLILKRFAEEKPEILKNCRFILHGDDKTVSTTVASLIVKSGAQLASVNWMGDPSLVTPLPIGIATLDRMGPLSARNYRKYIRFFMENNSRNDKDIFLFGSFDLTTNFPIRKVAYLSMLRTELASMETKRLSLFKNLDLIRRARYVISPPGAGPDCFRTWEAMYLGAIPIVLKSHWPFSSLNLPVIVLDSYKNLEQAIMTYETNQVEQILDWENYFLQNSFSL
jgi:hypothetical protein